jgi:muramoyltetrapeptide carboxypeptidase
VSGGRRRPLLRRGDTVGVVATGFAVQPARLAAGVRELRRMGFAVRIGEHVGSRDGYLAGPDESRAGDLRAMLRAPDVRAVWFARGGYGTARILDSVAWRLLRDDPKPLIGYSDLTALFCPVVRRTEAICLYGPVVAELGAKSTYHAPSLSSLLAGRPVELRIDERQALVPGRARGRLIGGNLTVLAHLCGTRHAPDLQDAVLVLEDVGEQTYRIDRALTQLRTAGAFRRLAGVLLGSFSVQPRRAFPPDRPLRDVLGETFDSLGVPVVTGVPVGHRAGKWTVPLGGTAEIDTRSGRVRFIP